MKWISDMILLYRSLLSKEEKRLLERVINLYKDGTDYKISNYDECRMFVNIGYKLDARMNYLYSKGKLHSDEYEDAKYKNQCISAMIKEFALSS